MSKMLEEFITYAKNEFGLVVRASESKKPETFEEIFGISCMDDMQQIMSESYLYGSNSELSNCEDAQVTYDCSNKRYVSVAA